MRWIAALGVTQMIMTAWGAPDGEAPQLPSKRFESNVPIRAITAGPRSHWFGYYDKLQFDPSGRYALGMAVEFDDRPNTPDDIIELGTIDIENGDAWTPFAETTAWCWQQGCMLQWIPGSASEVIYNVRENGQYKAVIRDVFTGATRTIPSAIYAVSPDGKRAVCPNFARLGTTRPGYGYYGIADPFAAELAPENDGIYAIDLATSEVRLLFSVSQVAHFGMEFPAHEGKHWFNHLLFSPGGARFIFLHRWHHSVEKTATWHTRMLTAAPDGSDLRIVADHEMVSHFIWKDPAQILAWSREPEKEDRFHLYDEASGESTVVGDGVLMRDGHCTYSPGKQWVLTDQYRDKDGMQPLMLYRPSDGRLEPLGKFYIPPSQTGEIRCDLHPRWSRDGKYVCIDSMHENNQRQIYLLDVSAIVGAE
ncbi:MAG: hypothetical protein QG656_782 [Candidatus Hydrogenedentes bacterium]|nr:hypothetical protein [Candidatus Hydrogenedentota bacterium]